MPPTDTAIALLTQRVETMHEGFGEMKAVLQKLADAVNTMALVEERQAQLSAAIERAFNSIEKIERRVASLELLAPSTRQTNEWVTRGIFAVAAAALTFIAKKVGLV